MKKKYFKNLLIISVLTIFLTPKTFFAEDFRSPNEDNPIDTNKTSTIENKNNSYKSGDIIHNYNDFCEAIEYGLSNYKNKLVLTIKDYNSDIYSLQKVVDEILIDDPLLDYGYNSIRIKSMYYNNGNTKITVSINYDYSVDYMRKIKIGAEKKSDEIIGEIIKSEMKDYEKVLVVHDYIINNTRYDIREHGNNLPHKSYTDYGVLVDGTGVTEGYAKAMYRILNKIGIECIFVRGHANNGTGFSEHFWNMVKIDNQYYHVDTAWDDPEKYSGQNTLMHTFFNLTDDEISRNHVWDSQIYPKCYSKEYSFDNLGITEIDKNGNPIVVIKNYDQLYNTLKEAMENKKATLVMKVLNYNDVTYKEIKKINTYYLNKTMDNIVSNNPNIQYNGFLWQHSKDKISDAVYLKIHFK